MENGRERGEEKSVDGGKLSPARRRPKTFRGIRRGAPAGDQKRQSRNEDEGTRRFEVRLPLWESKHPPPDPLRGSLDFAFVLVPSSWSAVRVWIMAVARGVYESTKADYRPLIRIGVRLEANFCTASKNRARDDESRLHLPASTSDKAKQYLSCSGGPVTLNWSSGATHGKSQSHPAPSDASQSP
uniref:Uncharacterized protein n=1 Tax=Vespula pensylvanica TaxID=30213 RepID=A0A834KHQ0_VESPE|nr:hypothetical protein H0235_014403 [Vespula pensylvanica]